MQEWLVENAPILVLISIGGTILWKLATWFQRVNTDRESFKAFMEDVNSKLTSISENINKLFTRVSVMEASSPLQLNKLGRDISKFISAKKWAEGVANSLKEKTRDKTDYEIQEFCFDYFRNEFKANDEQDATLKECAYENGVPVSVVLDVLALEMRDNIITTRQATSDIAAAAASDPSPE